MSLPNYSAEGRIRQVCAEAGMLTTALEDVVARFRDNQFTEAELPAKIKEWRETPGHYFFVVAGAEHDELFAAAFGPNSNYTKRAQVVKLVGEAKAREIAARFGTTLGGKGGTIPEGLKVKTVDADPEKPSTNPWSAHPSNLDARGNYSSKATLAQAKLVRGLGAEKAAEIAFAANGAKLGDIRPNQRRRVA